MLSIANDSTAAFASSADERNATVSHRASMSSTAIGIDRPETEGAGSLTSGIEPPVSHDRRRRRLSHGCARPAIG
jgi:hypothetical protein